jgi:hypothetical protein
MKFVMHWEVPVEKWQDAMFAYSDLVSGGQKGLEVDLYWAADASDGNYRGIGIMEVESEEALFEFFNVVGGIARVKLTPAVGGEPLRKLWQEELGRGSM